MKRQTINLLQPGSRQKSFLNFVRPISFISAVTLATVYVVYVAAGANTTIGNNISTSGTLTVGGTAQLSGILNASSTLQVTGTTTLYGKLAVGTTSPSQALSVQGNALISGDVTLANVTATGTAILNNITITGSCIGCGSGSGTVSSSTAAGQIPFYETFDSKTLTATSTITLTSAGNVGIGTTSPSQLLAVQGNALFSGDLNVANITATGTLAGQILSLTGASGTSTLAAGQGFVIGGSKFAVQQGSGYVGIGTSTPLSPLHISSNQDSGILIIETYGANLGFTPAVAGFSAGGSASVPIATAANQDLLFIGGRGYQTDTGAFGVGSKAAIRLRSSEAWTSTAQGTHIRFETTSIGSTARTERMRLTDAGNLGIGVTSPSAKLHVGGDIWVGGGGGGSVVRIVNGSDARIIFDNTNHNWQAATDSDGDRFIILDEDSGTTPFVIRQGASDNLLYLTGNNLGIGTTSPSAKIAITGSGTGSGRAFAIANSSNIDKVTVLDNGNTIIDNGTTGLLCGGTDALCVSGPFRLLNGSQNSGRILVSDASGLASWSNSLIVDGSNVGIGTTSPSQTLAVHGNALFSGNISSVANITATGTLSLTGTTGTSTVAAGQGFIIGGNKLVVQGTNGKIGFGVTSPQATIDVQETGLAATTIAKFRNTSGTVIGDIYTSGGSGFLSIYLSDGSERIRLASSGDAWVNMGSEFGVGNTNPQFKLDVGGDTNLSSGSVYRINGTSVLSSSVLGSGITGSSLTSVGALNFGSITSGFGSIDIGADTLNAGTTTITNLAVTNTSSSTFAGPISNTSGSLVVAPTGTTNNLLLNPYGGNVGIGTSAPSRRLTIRDSDEGFQIEGLSGGNFLTLDGQNRRITGSSGLNFRSSGIANTEMTLTGGNLGIGTTSPTQLLSVQGNALFSGDLSVANITATGTFTTSGLFTFGNASGTQLTTSGSTYLATAGGNVGIGTAAPLATLDVLGEALVSGDLAIGYNGFAPSGNLRVRTHGDTILLVGSSFASKVRIVATQTNSSIGFGSEGEGGDRLRIDTSISGNPSNDSIRIYNVTTGLGLDIAGNGFVGIGTTSPSQTLAVQGNALFSGNLNVANITATGTLNVSGLATLGNASTSVLSASTAIFNADGSAASPSYTFSNDPDTGIYRSSDNTLRFSTGGTERVRITSSGTVGIGLTSDPLEQLQVNGSILIPNFQFLRGRNSANNASILAVGISNQNTISIGSSGNTDSGVQIYSAGSEAVRIDTSGRFGIGTTSPSQALAVQGNTLLSGNLSVANITATGTLTLSGGIPFSFSNPATTTIASNLNAYSIATSTTGRPSISVDGNTGGVAIGRASSTAQLAVAGNIDNILLATTSPYVINPQLVGSLSMTGRTLQAVGKYLYVLQSNALQIVDVSNPSSPATVGSVSLVTTDARDLFISGRYAYTVSGDDKFEIIDISNSAAPARVSSVSTGSGSNTNSVYVSGKYAYVGRNADAGGFQVYDVSNPSNPKLIGQANNGSSSESFGLAVLGRYAFIQNQHNLRVFDISNPNTPTSISNSNLGFNAPRSMYVSGRYLYVANNNNASFNVVDISNPASPSLVVTVGGIGTSGGGDGAHSVFVAGRYLFIMGNSTQRIMVFDVSVASSPVAVGNISLGGFPAGFYKNLFVAGRYMYTLEGTTPLIKIYDISGLETTSAIVHSLEAGNLQVRNNLLAYGIGQFSGGLNVGVGGIYSSGALGVSATNTSSSILGNLAVGTSTSAARFTIWGSGTGTGNALEILDNASTTRFVVQDNGNVGIGTTSPTAQLSVEMGANPFAFWVGDQGTSTPAFTVTGNGRVGIGRALPSDQLSVEADFGVGSGEHFISHFTLPAPSSSGVFLGYRADGASVTSALLRAGGSIPLTLGTSGSNQAVTILNSGNVGIGSTSPTKKLSIDVSALDGIRIARSDTPSIYGDFYQDNTQSQNAFALSAGGNRALSWDIVSANVLIGNNLSAGLVPAAKLHVNGSVAIGYTGSTTPPSQGLVVSGNVGIGTTTTNSKLSVEGGVSIGNSGAASPTNGLLVTGNITSPGTGSNSEKFGLSATASGNNSTALGNGATASAQDATAVGLSANATGTSATAFGYASGAGLSSTAIGAGATASVQGSVALGLNSSVTGSGAEGVAIGKGAVVTGALGPIAIGNSATASGGRTISIGYSTSATDLEATVIGWSASAGGTQSIALGAGATVGSGRIAGTAIGSAAIGGYHSVSLGYGASGDATEAIAIGFNSKTTGNTNSIALGTLASTTAANQMVIGASDGNRISDIYFGEGYTDATPTTYTLRATGGSGTNIQGGDLQFAGGQGTGSGAGGSILFQTAAAGGSGSLLNSLSTRMAITSAGNVGIGTTNPTGMLDLNGGQTDTVGSSTIMFSDSAHSMRKIGIRMTADPTADLAFDRLFTSVWSEAMRLQRSTGNLGIGTTSPGTLLSLGNTGNDTINISPTATSTFGSGINLRTGCFAINGACVSGGGGGGSGTVNEGTQGQVAFYDATGTAVSGTSSIFIAQNNRVGIGTTNPQNILSVAGFVDITGPLGIGTTSPASGLLSIENTGTGYTFYATDQANDTTPFVIDASGQVGIGKSNPGFPLDVNGNIQATNVRALTQFLSQGGSTGAPDYSSFNDSDTGMFLAGSNLLTLVTGATERFRINSDGKIGIATTTTALSQLLNVHGNALFSGNITSVANITATGTLTVAGDVGIGTVNPGSTLDITRSIQGGSPYLNITMVEGSIPDTGPILLNSSGTDFGLGYVTDNNSFSIKDVTAGSIRFHLDNLGNIGIGTSTVNYGLTVDKRKTALNFGNDGTLDSFSTVTSLSSARYKHTSVTANGYVYAIGGLDGSSVRRDTVLYAKVNGNGTIGPWSTNQFALAAARDEAASVIANGYVYVIGGGDALGINNTSQFAKLNNNGSTGPWATSTSNLPWARRDHTAVVANGFVYAIGGNWSGGNGTTTINYAKLNSDGTIGTWATSTNSLPAARGSHGSVVVNGYVYVIGGNDNLGSAVSTVYYAKLNADGTLGAWQTANALPAARHSLSAAANNGYIYASGGNEGFGSESAVYYARVNNDGSLSAWASTNSLPDGRSNHTSVTVNGYIYTFGGLDGGSQVTAVNYYSSAARTLIAGSLDLFGLASTTLSDPSGFGSTGGSLFAGSIFSNGMLEVTGNTQLWNGLSVSGTISLQAATSTGNQASPVFSITTNATSTAANTVFSVSSTGSTTLSQLTINNNFDAGSTTPSRNTLYKENIVKAWVTFFGNAGTIEIADGFNVSSITDNGTGNYTVNWITPFATANYASFISCQRSDAPTGPLIASIGTQTTTSAQTTSSENSAGTITDCLRTNIMAIGDQ